MPEVSQKTWTWLVVGIIVFMATAITLVVLLHRR